MKIQVKVNGTAHTSEVEPRLLLVHYLRDVLNLTGTHVGCDTSQCGACTIIVNGRSTKACNLFAVQADGAEIERRRLAEFRRRQAGLVFGAHLFPRRGPSRV